MLNSIRPSLALANRIPTTVTSVRTSTTTGSKKSKPLGVRKHKKPTQFSKINQIKFAAGFRYVLPETAPTSQLATTKHPQDKFAEQEEALLEEIQQLSVEDMPLGTVDHNPYEKQPAQCILCPKRYVEPIEITYKNPKLLSQFLSPHTGLMYKKHITGLCEAKQNQVEKEILRAQHMGM